MFVVYSQICKSRRAAYISDDQETAMVALVDSVDDGPCSFIVPMYVHLFHFREHQNCLECVIRINSGKLRQFLCINGACTYRLSWHGALLNGLDPSRNKDYSLRSMHVLLQLHDACVRIMFASRWHCLPYGTLKTPPFTSHQLDRQLQLPGALSCDTMWAALGPELSFPTLGMMRLGRSQLTKSCSSGKLLCSE